METITIFKMLAKIHAMKKSYEQPDHEVMQGEWEMQSGARYALDELKTYLEEQLQD